MYFSCPHTSQLCIREWQQASATESISSNESLFRKGLSLSVIVISLTHVQNDLTHTHTYNLHKRTVKDGTSCQVTVPAVRPADQIAATRWHCWACVFLLQGGQGDGITFFRLTASNPVSLPNGEPVQLPTLQEATDKPLPCKQNAACRPHQLPNHTQCQIQRAKKTFPTLQSKQ